MTVRFVQWTIDVADTERAAQFWSQALDYDVHAGDDGHAWLVARGIPSGTEPTVWLQHVPDDAARATKDEQPSKNRTHPDVVPLDGAEVDAEVERLVRLGATHADVGQTGDEGFVVLRDPDGNEFCVLRRFETADGAAQVAAELFADVDAILLDVDGTLVDSNYHHVLAWQQAFRANGLIVPTADIHAWVGMGGDQLVPAVAGDAFESRRGDSVREMWRKEYDARIGDVTVLPGAADLVEALAGLGRPVMLASSAPQPHIERYLDLLDVRDLLAGWTSSDDVEATKPAPDLLAVARDRVHAQQPVAIGDSPWDCRAAQHLGITSIGVGTGGFTAEQQRSAGAKAVYSALQDLADAVRRLG